MALDIDAVANAMGRLRDRKREQGKDAKNLYHKDPKFHFHTVDEIKNELGKPVDEKCLEKFLNENSDYFVKDRDNEHSSKYRKKFRVFDKLKG